MFPQLPSRTSHSHLTALACRSSSCSSLHDCANVLVNRSVNKLIQKNILIFLSSWISSPIQPIDDTREFVMCYNMEAGTAPWDGSVEEVAIQPQYRVALPPPCVLSERCAGGGSMTAKGNLSTGRYASTLPPLFAHTFLLLGSLLSHFSLLHQLASSVWSAL